MNYYVGVLAQIASNIVSFTTIDNAILKIDLVHYQSQSIMFTKKILLAQFDLHNALFHNVLDGITEEEADTSIAGMNTIKWLAGHTLWDLGSYANICGIKIAFPWFGHFYSKEAATPEDIAGPTLPMPTLVMIIANWDETVPVLRAGLEKLTADELQKVVNVPHPLSSYNNTLAGWWAYTNDHHAYNIGQMSVLRKAFGKKGMSYA